MQEKLSALAAHLTEVEQQLADPAVYADREKLTALRREQKELAPVVECWQEMCIRDSRWGWAVRRYSRWAPPPAYPPPR